MLQTYNGIWLFLLLIHRAIGSNQYVDEAKNILGPNRCATHGDCSINRVCSSGGWCIDGFDSQSTKNDIFGSDSTTQPGSGKVDEMKNLLGPHRCKSILECSAERTCSPHGWCVSGLVRTDRDRAFASEEAVSLTTTSVSSNTITLSVPENKTPEIEISSPSADSMESVSSRPGDGSTAVPGAPSSALSNFHHSVDMGIFANGQSLSISSQNIQDSKAEQTPLSPANPTTPQATSMSSSGKSIDMGIFSSWQSLSVSNQDIQMTKVDQTALIKSSPPAALPNSVVLNSPTNELNPNTDMGIFANWQTTVFSPFQPVRSTPSAEPTPNPRSQYHDVSKAHQGAFSWLWGTAETKEMKPAAIVASAAPLTTFTQSEQFSNLRGSAPDIDQKTPITKAPFSVGQQLIIKDVAGNTMGASVDTQASSTFGLQHAATSQKTTEIAGAGAGAGGTVGEVVGVAASSRAGGTGETGRFSWIWTPAVATAATANAVVASGDGLSSSSASVKSSDSSASSSASSSINKVDMGIFANWNLI